MRVRILIGGNQARGEGFPGGELKRESLESRERPCQVKNTGRCGMYIE